jgi:hypothetical protein
LTGSNGEVSKAGMEMYGSFYSNEGDKRDVKHRALGSEDDPKLSSGCPIQYVWALHRKVGCLWIIFASSLARVKTSTTLPKFCLVATSAMLPNNPLHPCA